MKKVDFSVRVVTIPKSFSRAGSNTPCQNLYQFMFSSAALKSSHLIARRNQVGGKKSNKRTSIFHFYKINFRNSNNKIHFI